MSWNWQLSGWPNFTYNFPEILQKERQFLLEAGSACAFLKTLNENDHKQLVVEILSLEGLESSRIEGEILDRESLQSSIKKHFGLQSNQKEQAGKEKQIAELLCHVYESFDQPLTHEMLYNWHAILFKNQTHIEDCGRYRTHSEPMQIVSSRYGLDKVFFEAPPSAQVFEEMATFIDWFNSSRSSDSILARAAIAHLYFENIHPFEDGNGRLGRILVEKILSQGVERPVLMATSKILEKRKKEYYAALEKCNHTLEVGHWVQFFIEVILQAQKQSMDFLYFLIEKSKMLRLLTNKLNARQEKVLLKLFAEGLEGFKGGLTAEKYIAMTKTSKATATRDLADLVEKGALIRTGELRHTRYHLYLKEDKKL